MIDAVIAKRYSRALFSVARQEDSIDLYLEQLKKFLKICDINSNLFPTLANKGFDMAARLRILDQVLKQTDLSQYVRNFLALLIRKGRMELMHHILDEYETITHQMMNRGVMTVVSAIELPQDQYDALVEHFSHQTKQKMNLRKKIDQKVLGGVRVHIGDSVFDYTLKNQLEAIQHRMLT